MFDVLKVARPVCSRLHFDFSKHFTKINIYLQKRRFLHFLPKNAELKDFFPKHHQTVVHIMHQSFVAPAPSGAAE